MSYIIAVCHQKGGVAKTTTTLALGACLVEQQCETLMIDLDPQANLTFGMGLNPAEMRRSAADVLLGNDTLLRLSRETSLPGLDVIPSNADMLTVSKYLYLRSPYEYLLRDSLANANLALYETVLIDCPPSLGPLTVSALTAANLVVIPTQCEYFSIQALNSTLKLINMVRARTNPQLESRLLVTMFDQRGHLHSRVLAHLQQHFSNSLLQTMIGVDSKLRESQLAGRPITVHANSSRGAQHYRQLAEELLIYVRRQVFQTA
jgi:chromosome partitioning protein